MTVLLKNSRLAYTELPQFRPTGDHWWDAPANRLSSVAPAAIIDGTDGDDDLTGTGDRDIVNDLDGDGESTPSASCRD